MYGLIPVLTKINKIMGAVRDCQLNSTGNPALFLWNRVGYQAKPKWPPRYFSPVIRLFIRSQNPCPCIFVIYFLASLSGKVTKLFLYRFPCGICILPPAKRLLIKGVCGKDVENNFYDFDFGVYGTKNGRPLFRGSKNSNLFYDSETGKWDSSFC